MSESEIRKLAHTLGVEPERLASLRLLPSEDLRTLRAQIGEALFEADRAAFAKVAALAKAVPIPVAAKLTQHAFSPLLAARTAELIDPGRASELVARLSDEYLADVSAMMDPSRAPAVIAGIAPERIARVGAELARRGEWIVIAGFIDVVSGAALAATVHVFDGAQLLRIGFVLDDKSRLDQVAALISDQQVDELLAAAHEHELWTELDDLLTNIGEPRRERMAGRLGQCPPETRAAILAASGHFRAEWSPTGDHSASN